MCVYHSISIESISALSTRKINPLHRPQTSLRHVTWPHPIDQSNVLVFSWSWWQDPTVEWRGWREDPETIVFFTIIYLQKGWLPAPKLPVVCRILCIYIYIFSVYWCFFCKRIAWSEAIIIGFLLFMHKPFRMETKLKLIERTRNTTKNKKQQKKKDTPRNSVFQTSQHG